MANLKYDQDFPARAEDLARQGLKDDDIAKKLGISRTVYYEYQKTYPDFKDAIKRGKAPIDFEVENKLLKRAQGYDYEEVHAEYNVKKTGEEKALPSKIKKIKKFIPPDVTAQIFWLKNRRPKIWRDKHDIDLTGNMNITVITAVPRPKEKNKRAPEPQLRSNNQPRKARKSAAGGRGRPRSGAPDKKKIKRKHGTKPSGK